MRRVQKMQLGLCRSCRHSQTLAAEHDLLLAAVAAAFYCHLPIFAAINARFAFRLREYWQYWQQFLIANLMVIAMRTE